MTTYRQFNALDMRNLSFNIIGHFVDQEDYRNGTVLDYDEAREYRRELHYRVEGEFSWNLGDDGYPVDPDPLSGYVTYFLSKYSEYDFNNDVNRSFGMVIQNFKLDASYFYGGHSNQETTYELFKGDDNITGSDGNDYLMGYAGADVIYGGDGKDTIDGGAGEDVMMGGLGDDTYIVDNERDVVWEYRNEGTDTVRASTDYRLFSNIENLTLTGSGDLTGAGNEFANTIIGNSGSNTLLGEGGNDSITGGAGDDRLFGGAGADVLNGGSGSDTAGYSGSTQGITVSLKTPSLNTGEAKGDTYVSIENLSGSSYNDTLYGNDSANRITGGSGDDVIYGGLGKDELYGGAGRDTFVFDTKLSATNVDFIADFYTPYDTIRLDDDIFTKAGPVGTLKSAAFYAGSSAHDSDDRIIYDKASGKIYYDADGKGGAAAVLFAQVEANKMTLTYNDFDIIA